MEPRVTKHERRLDLSYELPQRVRCSAVYPIAAPNGSTIIIYGTESGLRILWRGGRRIKLPQHVQVTKPSSSDVIVLDDSDDDIPTQPKPDTEPGYEGDEADLDEEDLYPGITHDITLPTVNAISRIAVPIVTSQWPSNAPEEILEEAVVTVATTVGEILLLRIPLSPLASFGNESTTNDFVSHAAKLSQGGAFVHDLSIRFFGSGQNAACVAAITSELHLWRFELEGLPDDVQQLTVALDHTPTAVSFHPTSRQPLLLMSDVTGTCHIVEPASTWPLAGEVGEPSPRLRWLADLHAPFAAISSSSPSLPRRKTILDAQWVLGGRCVFMVFDDSAWGLWDTTASYSKGTALADPVISGYLDSASSTEVADTTGSKRAGPLLAPMTPNTRRVKSNTLFSAAQSRPAGGVSRGGVSVSRVPSIAGSVDECVVIWLQDQIYTIPSMQTFWQRSTSGSGGLGSLYAPGIAHIPALDLFHECISSVSRLPPRRVSSSSSKFNKAPDLILSAESRLIILQHKATSGTLISTEKYIGDSEVQDQRMLDAGELDLTGMDRILDNMTSTDARPRRVGFAH